MTSQKQAVGEAVKCPACGQESQLLLKARDLNREVSENQFAYYSCLHCGVVHLFPIPADLGNYYAKQDKLFRIPGSIEELKAKGEFFKPRIAAIQRFKTKGKLLDVGASFGTFVHLAQRNGFDVEALEMDSASCQYMQEIGIRAICASSLESAEGALDMYDVITLFHVIEHLEDPRKTLTLLAQHLSPDGILVITTPNPESLQFSMLGRFWVNLDAPRHLSLIPQKALRDDAAQNGLEFIWSSSSDAEALAFSDWSWEASILNFLRSAKVMPTLGIQGDMAKRKNKGAAKILTSGREFFGKALAIVLGRIVSIGLAPFEKSLYRGSSYLAVFRQKSARVPQEVRMDRSRESESQTVLEETSLGLE